MEMVQDIEDKEVFDEDFERQYEKNRGGRKQIKMGTTRRNARERNRVRHINACFEVLRQHIPNDKHNKKLSKVDTLKSAMIYIENLRQLLQSSTSLSSSSSLTSTTTTTTTTTSSSNFYQDQHSNSFKPVYVKQQDYLYWQTPDDLSD